jgi:hypothetical protein
VIMACHGRSAASAIQRPRTPLHHHQAAVGQR